MWKRQQRCERSTGDARGNMESKNKGPENLRRKSERKKTKTNTQPKKTWNSLYTSVFLHIMPVACKMRKYHFKKEGGGGGSCPFQIGSFPCFGICLCYGRWRCLMPLVVLCTWGINTTWKCEEGDAAIMTEGNRRTERIESERVEAAEKREHSETSPPALGGRGAHHPNCFVSTLLSSADN